MCVILLRQKKTQRQNTTPTTTSAQYCQKQTIIQDLPSILMPGAFEYLQILISFKLRFKKQINLRGKLKKKHVQIYF